jgi:hypothetical protein
MIANKEERKTTMTHFFQGDIPSVSVSKMCSTITNHEVMKRLLNNKPFVVSCL